jgi:hypothetical protein
MIVQTAWRAVTLAGVLLAGISVGVAAEKRDKSAKVNLDGWKGPDKDFRIVDGRIFGEWWQGGGFGVVYFTGPDAQQMAEFEQIGRKIATGMKRPYLEIHKEHLQPSTNDANGIIAYPDGTARVRLFIFPGGNCGRTVCDIANIPTNTTDQALVKTIGEIPRAAFRSGMNFVGVCAGCFAATSGVSKPGFMSYYWGIWPGKFTDLGPGMNPPFPDVVVDDAMKTHPLYKATKKGRLDKMFFNGGPLALESDVPDTEYFGKYEGGNMPEIVGSWFLIAYRPKDNGLSGRLVACTGHPEDAHQEFLQAMCEYAIAHDYEVPRRPVKSGESVEGIVGDNQMHYYNIEDVPAGGKLTVTLTGMSDNCDLYLRQTLPPTFAKRGFASKKTKTADELINVGMTKPGEYWIGVHGAHQTLNGAKYELKVTVTAPPARTP